MNRLSAWLFALALFTLGASCASIEERAARAGKGTPWIATWAAAPQPAIPGSVLGVRNRTLRLVAHVSAGGRQVRVRLSNSYGDRPLVIGAAHLARRVSGADVDSATDRALTFAGRPSVTIPPGASAVSAPVDLVVPPLSDLAVSVFLPESSLATTSHALARQTSYVSDTGDFSGRARLPVARTIRAWPFLTGIDVAGAPGSAVVVAFGSSTTDGDGSTLDANRRYPDVLAARLQSADGRLRDVAVVNEGIIGNRLLDDSPRELADAFGRALGEAGLARFDRDVLAQAGVAYVIVALGVNDILMPGSFTPAADSVSADAIIAGYRQLVARAHRRGVRVILTTIPPFEGATFTDPVVQFFTPAKDAVRAAVNDWIRRSGNAFDGMVDFDAVLRDPTHPSRLLPAYDAGDHLHMNDAGYAVTANAIPLALFQAAPGHPDR